MKVQVTIKASSSQKQFGDSFAVVVSASDTVATIKDRVATAQAVPFPEQELLFKGSVLADGRSVADCGVKEGDSLDFVVRSSEATFTQQISELLKVTTVSATELDLLYVHKYGVNTREALRMLGLNISLQEFLLSQKVFAVTDGGCKVALARTSDDLIINLRVLLESTVPGGVETSLWDDDGDDAPIASVFDITAEGQETVATVTARAAAAAGIPGAFPDLELTCDGRPLVSNLKLQACDLNSEMQVKLIARTSDANLAEQLKGLLVEGGMTIEELGLMFSCKYGVDVRSVLRSIHSPTRGRTLSHFLRERPELFDVRGGRVSQTSAADLMSMPPKAQGLIHQQCLDVHGSVSSRDFRMQAFQAVSKLTALLMQATFLHIHHFVTGGSVGKDTAIEGSATAEVTLFLAGVPWADLQPKLPELLDSLAAFLREKLATENCLQGMDVLGVRNGAVRVAIDGLSSADVYLSPTFSTHGDALDQIQLESEALELTHAAFLAEQEVRFIKKQPEAVKVTMRLLKSWRGRHSWSSDKAQPSDRFLELLAVHVATTQLPLAGKPYDQAEALGFARSFMMNLDTLNVSWPVPLYGKCKIPAQLLKQQPLLMDPVNPFINVANPSTFDPSEMMAHATRSSHHLL